MATDSILGEMTDYERGYEEGVSRAISLRPDELRQQLADLTTQLSVARATIEQQRRGIEERDRAARDAAARVADLVYPCVVCRTNARCGTSLVCEGCR